MKFLSVHFRHTVIRPISTSYPTIFSRYFQTIFRLSFPRKSHFCYDRFHERKNHFYGNFLENRRHFHKKDSIYVKCHDTIGSTEKLGWKVCQQRCNNPSRLDGISGDFLLIPEGKSSNMALFEDMKVIFVGKSSNTVHFKDLNMGIVSFLDLG